MLDRLVIATRESPLALWQARFIKEALEARHPGLVVSLLGMRTAGDRWLSTPLSEVGGKGLFIKELEQALLSGAAHLAVHSMKDVPALLEEPFVLGAIGFRDDVRDALVGPAGTTVAGLPQGARVGSASLRRRAQLLARRPDLDVQPVRGNVGTRLGKLDAGEFDALLLAAAGLRRLGLEARVAEYLTLDDSLPAAGQGALGIECLADNSDVLRLVATLDDPVCAPCVRAERGVSAGLGADCSAPLGAYAEALPGGKLLLKAVLADPDGRERLRASATGADPAELAARVVADLRDQGAARILARLAEPRLAEPRSSEPGTPGSHA
jgi:hydroxymethylbilane synthase